MVDRIIHWIDAFVDTQGKISSFVVYPLMLVVLFEVIMRYVFNAPTIWGFEATTFLYGIHFMLGLSFMERYGGHVRVDVLTSRLSEKTQAIMGIITYAVIFLPVYFLMTLGAIRFAYVSTASGELNSTSWAPPIWPIKIIMALSFLFLLLQGIATLLKHIRALSAKQEPKTAQ